MAKFCQLSLTCKDKPEADKIAKSLLVKHLIACARQIPVSSNYRWKGKIKSGKEIVLIMESKLENFSKIEAEIAKLHSYDTFVLEALAVKKISKNASGWLEKELGYV